MTDTFETVGENEGSFKPLFDINTLLKTLWQRKLVIAAAVGIMIVLAGGYVALTKPTYTASASILVDPRDSRATNFNTVLPGLGADSAAISSQVSVIESRNLLDHVFQAQHLMTDPEYTHGGLLSSIKALVKKPKPLTREAVFGTFRNHVSVNREGLTYVIDVNVTSHDAKKAALLANAIVDRYKASLAGEKESANNEVTDFLEQKINGLQQKVSDTDRAVEDFRFKNKIYDARSGGTLQSQIDQLSTQLGDAQSKVDQAQNRYQQALDAGDTPKGMVKLANILSSPTADNLRQEYNTDAAALADAQTVYGSRHPTIRRLKAQLAKAQGLMIREADRITAQLKADRDLAVQNVDKLQSKLSALREQSNKSDLSRVKLRGLQRQADAARSVLDDFLKRSQETSQLKGIQLSQVRIISNAEPPTGATWPKPKLLLPVSAVLGLIAGCCLALLMGPKAEHAAGRRNARFAGAPNEPPVAAALVPATRVRPESTELTPAASLASLGTYDIPAASGSSARSIIRGIRMDVQDSGKSEMSLSVLRLLRQIIGRLRQHNEPFVLTVSSIDENLDGKLATALVGIGLRQLEEKVLVLEIADHPEEPGPLTSVSSRHGTAIFTDPSSGLQTMVASSDDTVSEILSRYGRDFNFVLVFSCPMNDPGYSRGLEATADLTIVALTPAEEEAGAATMLANRLDAGSRERMATMVVNRVDTESDADAFTPRLVASSAPSNGQSVRREG